MVFCQNIPHTTHSKSNETLNFLVLFSVSSGRCCRHSNARSVTSHFASYFLSFFPLFCIFMIFPIDQIVMRLRIIASGDFAHRNRVCWKQKHKKWREKKQWNVQTNTLSMTLRQHWLPLNRLKRYNQIQSRSLAHAAKRWVYSFVFIFPDFVGIVFM